MKILQIIPDLNTGGAERFCVDLSNEMARSHDVVLCSLYPVTPSMVLAPQLSDAVRFVNLEKTAGPGLGDFSRLWRLVRQEQPDVIHTHLRALLYVAPTILGGRAKIFHTVHNLAKREDKASRRRVHRFLFNTRRVDPVSISAEVLKSVQEEYGARHTLCIDNGVALPRRTERYDEVCDEIAGFKPGPDTRVFVHIGRLAPQKNQHLLIEAFQRLIAEGWDLLLLIIGDDTSPDQSNLKSLQPLVNERIRLLGLRSNVSDYLLYAEGFCLSSRFEGMPITLLEALSLGTVSICTPVGGIPDVIRDGETGVLSKDAELDGYTDALRRFLNFSPEERARLSAAGQKLFAASYSITRTANEYLQAFAEK
jgi:glycosyltransferase involved in cell wall biosynthesis